MMGDVPRLGKQSPAALVTQRPIFPVCTPERPGPALVLARRGLADLELLEVPAADLHVAALLVHALGELLRSALAVVAPRAVVLLALLALRLHGALLGLGGRGRAAAEETADGVPDGRAHRHAAATR